MVTNKDDFMSEGDPDTCREFNNSKDYLNGPYWVLSTMGLRDVSYYDVNMDGFYWGNHNSQKNKASSHVLLIMTTWNESQSSWVLSAMENINSPVQNESNQELLTSNSRQAMPQYRFHHGIWKFSDDGTNTTKQELYKNLLGMDAVEMINPPEYNKLEKDLYMNTHTHISWFWKERGQEKWRLDGVLIGNHIVSVLVRISQAFPLFL